MGKRDPFLYRCPKCHRVHRDDTGREQVKHVKCGECGQDIQLPIAVDIGW